MLQSMGSQRVRHSLATEQHNTFPVKIRFIAIFECAAPLFIKFQIKTP